MGQCTSAESHRISSAANSPQIEFLPQIYSHQGGITGTQATQSKGPGAGAGAADRDSTGSVKVTTKDDGEGSPAAQAPIKGIRKLKPGRRKGFFLFQHKQHVTFVTTPQDPSHRQSIESHVPHPPVIQRRRICLQPPPPPLPVPLKVTVPRQSQSLKVNLHSGHEKKPPPGPANQECRNSIMGNNVQKSKCSGSKDLKSNNNGTKEQRSISSKTYHPLPSSRSSTAVLYSENTQRHDPSELKHRHIPTSYTSEDVSVKSSLVTAAELKASREEKNLLRARFFESTSSPSSLSFPNPDMSSMATNKFGYRHVPAVPMATTPALGTGMPGSGSCSQVPPKGNRTFQYQIPAPTRVTSRDRDYGPGRGTTSATAPTAVSHSGDIPSSSSSLSQLPNLNFIASKTQSKSATALVRPPPPPVPVVIDKNRFSWTESVQPPIRPSRKGSKSYSGPEGPDDVISMATIPKVLGNIPPAPATTTWPKNENISGSSTTKNGSSRNSTNYDIRAAGTSIPGHRFHTTTTGSSACTTSASARAPEPLCQPQWQGVQNQNHGFGWMKTTAAAAQVQKPSINRPFYLYSKTSDVASAPGFPGGSAVTGIVAQRKFQFEPRKLEPKPNCGNAMNEEHSRVGDHSTESSTTTGTTRTITSTSITVISSANIHVQDSKSKVDPGGLTSDEEKIDTSRESEGRGPQEVKDSGPGTAEGQVSNSESVSSTSSNVDSRPGSSDPAGLVPRPCSGRSLSRERDTPISDSEYLIDDEISDQPELTFNFKDSSLLVLSRSSSEDSLLLPYDVTLTSQSPLTASGTSARASPYPSTGVHPCRVSCSTLEDTKSDSPYSDVSSKPEDDHLPKFKTKTAKITPTRASPCPTSVKSQSKSSLPLPAALSRNFSGRRTIGTPNEKLKKDMPRSGSTFQKPLPVSITPMAKKISRTSVSSVTSTPVGKPVEKLTQVRQSVTKKTTPDVVQVHLKKRPLPVVVSQSKVKAEEKARSFTSMTSSCSSSSRMSKDIKDMHVRRRNSSTTTNTSGEESRILSGAELEEILENFGEVKTALVELEERLEEAERRESAKDEVIARLTAQLNFMKKRKCPSCGKIPFPSCVLQEDEFEFEEELEKAMTDFIPERISNMRN